MAAKTTVKINGKHLQLTNLQKVYYPKTGLTKAGVIDYYRQVAVCILPHLKDRPLTLKRYPDGVDEDFFYQKECPSHKPEWLKTSHEMNGTEGPNFCLVNNLPDLVWVANTAAIEMHPLLSRADDLNKPTSIVFDLDPGQGMNILDCAKVALKMKNFFDQLDMKCFPKTSGSKGMHLWVPLNTDVTFDDTKTFARQVARTFEKKFPDLIISKMTKSLRKNKIFIDWSQNDSHKTTVCVYSLRAKETPTVSTPLKWKEVKHAADSGNSQNLAFEKNQVIERINKFGDIFKPVLDLKQKLKK